MAKNNTITKIGDNNRNINTVVYQQSPTTFFDVCCGIFGIKLDKNSTLPDIEALNEEINSVNLFGQELTLKIRALEDFTGYKNMFSVIEKTKKKIIENNTPKNVDNIKAILDEAKVITDEEMQDLLAGILSEEYNTPNTIKCKTINVIKSISKPDLELFSKYLNLFTLGHKYMPKDFWSAEEGFTEMGYLFDEFLFLSELGLISTVDLSINLMPKNININFGLKTYFEKRADLIRIDQTNLDTDIKISCYSLTDSGVKISQYLEFEENTKYTTWLQNTFEKIGVGFKLTEI